MNLTTRRFVVRSLIAGVFLAAALALSAKRAVAESNSPPAGGAAVAAAEEGWSFDDIKDVCEAAQFIMIGLGVGFALHWYCCRYLPARDDPRIEFDVDIERAGERETAWLIEVVAVLKNSGNVRASFSNLSCVLKSVEYDLSSAAGPLARTGALSPLFEEQWEPASFLVDAGTRRRCMLAAAIPKSIDYVVVSATVKHDKRSEPYYASKCVRLSHAVP